MKLSFRGKISLKKEISLKVETLALMISHKHFKLHKCIFNILKLRLTLFSVVSMLSKILTFGYLQTFNPAIHIIHTIGVNSIFCLFSV